MFDILFVILTALEISISAGSSGCQDQFVTAGSGAGGHPSQHLTSPHLN